jgi:hypothetical protein
LPRSSRSCIKPERRREPPEVKIVSGGRKEEFEVFVTLIVGIAGRLRIIRDSDEVCVGRSCPVSGLLVINMDGFTSVLLRVAMTVLFGNGGLDDSGCPVL